MRERYPYFDYYHRAIQKSVNGLKLVLGGTGLGKTSAIVDVAQSAETDRKFIYCANRIQLLNEMADELKQRDIGYTHLQSDADVLLDILHASTSETGFYDLLESPHVQKYVEHINRQTSRQLSTPDIQKACETIKEGSRIGHSDFIRELVSRQSSSYRGPS